MDGQYSRINALIFRILSPPNMVNLTGRENGWYNGKEKISEKKTIVTTRVCAPASPGSTGAFASMPVALLGT